MDDLDDPITEEEVAAAIVACKNGKACGPDDLGNEWYKDHSARLVPILVKLFNECMSEGHTPASFLEAYIFSISKGGDHTNPLNYRPIALLNSDYKIFTRILAWRVRKYVDRLVNLRQCGFVPGRTIHEVIDILEAAKQICRSTGHLSEAQVLMLDFAKAYDSLDRGFLMEVLEAKGFPPRILRIIQAIHTDTTVQFLANGHVSEKLEVTRGIRQGCPLAPLLFIIAVDLLYDVVEGDLEVRGIQMEDGNSTTTLKIAGYADDTAIYIESRGMQSVVIQLVREFSAVSGLQLNVKKSAAMQLGADSENEGATAEQGTANEDRDEIPVTQSTRYLGHIAGTGNTVDEAWTKAFAALRVRLALAEVKTNTAQQRAEIAAAIIMPKLLYVARHAWPTEKICKQADQAIRNFVWNSAFRVPDRAPSGWVQAAIAEQKVLKGGLGIPNFGRELMAMSAMVVGEWALSTNPTKRLVGDIMQVRDTGECAHLSTAPAAHRGQIRATLRATGKPWVEQLFRERTAPEPETCQKMSELRKGMRHSLGLRTLWTTQGLAIRCEGVVRDMLRGHKQRRRQEAGECSAEAIMLVELQCLWVGNSQGQQGSWTVYKGLYPTIKGLKVRDIVEVAYETDGALLLMPKTHVLPLESRMAHQFREVCLCLVANYPELVGAQRNSAIMQVTHPKEDKHHVFEVRPGNGQVIEHSWGSTRQQVPWAADKQTVAEAVAVFLEADAGAVRVAPHPGLTKMLPLWTGKRRWTQSRRKYKEIISRAAATKAEAAQQTIRDKMTVQNAGVAKILATLPWKKIHRMEGASPYQQQNMHKLKLNRLRVWAGPQQGMTCQAQECLAARAGGTIHLAWLCPDAQAHWKVWLQKWGWDTNTGRQTHTTQATDIFGLRLRKMPGWLVQWGAETELNAWEALHSTADEMWALGVAVTVTALWRWNVDRLHPDGKNSKDLQDAVSGWRGLMREAFERYRLRLFPITANSVDKIRVAEAITSKWREEEGHTVETVEDDTMRVGFFDGGSRGNPGPGGSGSVVIKIGREGRATTEWVAVTALGGATMTNNIAEFVGLHRLLAHAVSKGWKQMHVVGDSMMIIRMMTSRTPPKSKRLKHWYQASIKLADMCAVSTWRHHYRAHNKMADWLANQAMDGKKSITVTYTEQGQTNRLQQGIAARMEGDVSWWVAQRKATEQE